MVIKSPTLKKCKCGMPSRIYDKKKYWCGINLEGHGYCKNDNKKNGDRG